MFKNILREIRKERGLSQVSLSTLLNISDKTVSSWEQGRTEPSMTQLKLMADIFNVDMNYLLNKIYVNPDETNNIYGDYEANLEYFADKPELLNIYKNIHENESLQLLFDSARDLSPEDLESVLIHIQGIRKARGLD